jgi:hypothetical protein
MGEFKRLDRSLSYQGKILKVYTDNDNVYLIFTCTKDGESGICTAVIPANKINFDY